jgi:two-component system sensor histidine kinase PrrB
VALFTALGTSVLMAVGVVFALRAFRVDQVSSIDAVLAAQHQILGQPAARAARLDRPLAAELAGEQLLAGVSGIRVWDGDRLLVAAGPDDLLALGPAAPGYSTLGGDFTGYRTLSEVVDPRRDVGRSVEVEIAISMAQADRVYQALRLRMRRLVILGTALFGLAGWAAAAGALAPLARLRRTTEEIARTNDLGIEVGVEPGPREVRELAASFDAMLARLRQAGGEREDALDAARIFAAAAAHELRTPLTSMGANLELLAAHPDTVDRTAVMGDLSSEHRRLVDLLEALRLLSRGDLTGPEAFEELDLADLAEQVVADAAKSHPEAAMAMDLPEGPVLVRGWPEGLRLLLHNLIVNAATHGQSADGSARIEVSMRHESSGLEVTVADHGPGIPPQDRERVLARFSRGASARGPGSGLGLALAVQQARIHHGSLAIEEGQGGGTMVVFRLPIGLILSSRWSQSSHKTPSQDLLDSDRGGSEK